jgi:hypothetical protein
MWYVHEHVCSKGKEFLPQEIIQISFSGSKDSQTSSDVVQGGVAVGAMSYVSDHLDRQVE